MRYLLFLFFLFASKFLFGQERILSGKITNNKLEPVAFASVQVKGTKNTTLTNEQGNYKLLLPDGVFTIVITMMGYEPRTAEVVLNKQDAEQNFILSEAIKDIENVTVTTRNRDKAEEYIRQVIANKQAIQNAAGAYSADVYIKAVQTDSIGKKKPTKDTVNKNFDRMALAEIFLKQDVSGKNIKETRTGIKQAGNTRSLFYLTTTDGDFNFYNNLVNVPSISVTPILSPISYSGLVAYRYRTKKIELKGNYRTITIGVQPGRLSNATVEGEVVITDSGWALLKTNFTFPKYHLTEYDEFRVQQNYEWVNGQAPMVTFQKFTYRGKWGKNRSDGSTTVNYSNFELNKKFANRYFGTELSSSTDSSYKRDSSFWNTVRTEPLTVNEQQFIRHIDSVKAVVSSKVYKDSVQAEQNKITWKKILYQQQPNNNWEKGTYMNFPSILTTFSQFLTFGGPRFQFPFWFKYEQPNKKNWTLFARPSYGFLNKDLNGQVTLSRRYNTFNQGYFAVRVQRDFQAFFSGDSWVNMLSRGNYFLNNSIGGSWGREIINGLYTDVHLDVALRRSLNNFKTYGTFDEIINNEVSNNNFLGFDPYNATYGKIHLRYTPFQPYIREPKEKIVLESKWPTFYAEYRLGIPKLFNSQVNFNYFEYGVRQSKRLGLAGLSTYSVKSGSFLSRKELKFADYKFQRRGDPYLFLNPQEYFQSLDSSFPVFNRFYEGHYLHEFNGAIFNKIPIFKKLGLREVVGGGFLFAPERNLKYGEAFVGVERVFKTPFQMLQKFKLGAYTTGAISNNMKDNLQFKVGITFWDGIENKWR